MAKQHYVQIFRRRRDGKTDYRKRRGLVQGKKPFLTVRVSNKYIYGQIMRPAPAGDLTLCACSSRNLSRQYGWKGSAKNVPAAYLTGYQLGKLAQEQKISGAHLYSGVSRFVHGSRIAAFLGGAREAGLELHFDEKILPDEQRIKGDHIRAYATRLSEDNSSQYNVFFSQILSRGLKPQDYPSHFAEIKASIEK